MKKIILMLLTVNLFCLNIRAENINAETQKRHETNNSCPLPRTTTTQDDEIFISYIEKKENISRNDPNVYVNYNGNNTVTITKIISDDNVISYTSLTPESLKEFQESQINNQSTRGILSLLWSAAVWLYNAYGVISTGCTVIENVSGKDVCGYIGQEVIKSLVKSGTRKRFRVLRYMVKDSCPYPPNSWQCNSYPYAYEKTELQAY